MMMLQKQWKDESQQLGECMSDAGVWALGHKVYCQLELLTEIWEMQMLINKSPVVLRLKILMLTVEEEPHQRMRILNLLIKWQTLVLGVQTFRADLQM